MDHLAAVSPPCVPWYAMLWINALLVAIPGSRASSADYVLTDHPRIFVNRTALPVRAAYAGGVMAREYGRIKAEADRAIAEGVRPMNSRFGTPVDLLCLGITYLIERQLGRNSAPYAEAVRRAWGDGRVLGLDGSGHFGYYAMVYDWIFDALTPGERRRYGDALGAWLRWYTDTPEITLQNGHWWYNQTWGPAHLNTPNTRDGIAPKLFVALAIAGAGTDHEADARRFVDR